MMREFNWSVHVHMELMRRVFVHKQFKIFFLCAKILQSKKSSYSQDKERKKEREKKKKGRKKLFFFF